MKKTDCCNKCGGKPKKTTSYCSPCNKAYMKAYRAHNKERMRAQQNAWNEANRPRSRELKRNYYRKNLPLWSQYENERRARVIEAEGEHTREQWLNVVCSQQNKCFDCDATVPLTRGHLVPLSRGGSDWITNIVAQCRPCNSRQATKIHSSLLPLAA